MLKHQKSFLIFLFLFILPLAYAMENNENKPNYNEKATDKLFAVLTSIHRNKYLPSRCLTPHARCQEQEALKQNIQNIKQLIDQQANPNLIYGESLISLAMYNKDLFYYLLQHGADINTINDFKESLIFEYVWESHWYGSITIEDLAKNGANLNATNKNKKSPLSIAIEISLIDSNLEIVKDLIKYRANVNQKCPIMSKKFPLATPLAECIISLLNRKSQLSIIKKLCKAGASLHNVIDYKNDNKNLQPYTAFHLAVKNYLSKTCLTTLLIDTQNSHEQQKSTERLITTLLVLRHRNIPRELQYSILSNLPENHCSADTIYSLLVKDFANFSILYPIRNHITKIQITLQQPSIHGTALECLSKEHLSNPNYIQDVQKLLDPDRLENDYKEFLHTFPDLPKISPENLALQLYNNSYN